MQNLKVWRDYMATVAGSDNDATIASRLGVSPSTIGRWRSGAVDPKPRQVVSFAKEYGDSPVAALVAAGYLTGDDLVGEISVRLPADVSDVSTLDLLEEVQTRLEATAEVFGLLSAKGNDKPASGRLGDEVLAQSHPGVAPSEFDGSVVTRALGAERIFDEGLGEHVSALAHQVSADAPTVTDAMDIADEVHGIDEGTKETYGLAARRGRRKADEQPHAE